MNKIVKKIKVLLGMVKEQFETAKLADGSEISFDALEVNREVYDAEGNSLPAGEYILEDGTKIELDENGVIKEIEKKDGEVEKEEVVEEMAEETETTETETTETETTETVEQPVEEPDKVKELEERVESIEKAVNEIYEMVLRISEKLKEEEVKVTETVEEFSRLKSQPSAEPIHFGKQTIKEENASPAERFLDFKKSLKNK